MTEFSNDAKRRIASGELTEPMWVPAGSLGRLTSRFQDVLDARTEAEINTIKEETGFSETIEHSEIVVRSRRHRQAAEEQI